VTFASSNAETLVALALIFAVTVALAAIGVWL